MTSQLLDEDIAQHRYAILSHTWGKDSDEVTFEDGLEGSGRDKAGYDKIKFCGEQAAKTPSYLRPSILCFAGTREQQDAACICQTSQDE